MSPTYKLAAVLAAIQVLPGLCIAAPTATVAKDDGFSSVQIIGGSSAGLGEFPFLVSLSQDGKHLCGGALLDANTVLTAAHCSAFQAADAARVRAGSNDWSTGGVQVGVSKILVNRNYSLTNKNNDVALWRLDTPIQASETIAYAKLPAAGSDPEAGTTVTIAGWGFTAEGGPTNPRDLLKVSMPVVDRASCKASYAGLVRGVQVTEQMVCAGLPEGGEGTCQGDSGGPLVDAATGTLVGVVSWAQGCARAGMPSVFARVGEFVDWINENR